MFGRNKKVEKRLDWLERNVGKSEIKKVYFRDRDLDISINSQLNAVLKHLGLKIKHHPAQEEYYAIEKDPTAKSDRGQALEEDVPAWKLREQRAAATRVKKKRKYKKRRIVNVGKPVIWTAPDGTTDKAKKQVTASRKTGVPEYLISTSIKTGQRVGGGYIFKRDYSLVKPAGDGSDNEGATDGQ